MAEITVGISVHSQPDDWEVQRQLWELYSVTIFGKHRVRIREFRSSGEEPTVEDVGFRNQVCLNLDRLLSEPSDVYFLLSADTWVLNPFFLEEVFYQLWTGGKHFAGSAFWVPGSWAFSLSFCGFSKQMQGLETSRFPRKVEFRLGSALRGVGLGEDQIFRLSPREAPEGIADMNGKEFERFESNRWQTLSLSLVEHHDLKKRQDILRFYSFHRYCPKIRELLGLVDLSVWNRET